MGRVEQSSGESGGQGLQGFVQVIAGQLTGAGVVAQADGPLQQGVNVGGDTTAGMVPAQGPSPSEEVGEARLMGGPVEAPIRCPAIADEHAVEVRPQQVDRFLVASPWLNNVDGRLLRRARPEPLQVAVDLPPGVRRQ